MAIPKKLLLVDDHPLMIEVLGTAIRKTFPDAEVFEVHSISAARDALKRERDFDLVLLDLRRPDTQGVSGLLSLKVRFPELKFLVVSAYAHPDTIANCFLVGASGFLSKSLRRKELATAIREVIAGGRVLPSQLKVHEDEAAAVPRDGRCSTLKRLTFQQARVLHHVCNGLLNKQIAYELGVGETTVKAHMCEVFRKLNVVSRTQALVTIMRLEPAHAGGDFSVQPTAKTVSA